MNLTVYIFWWSRKIIFKSVYLAKFLDTIDTIEPILYILDNTYTFSSSLVTDIS